MSVNALAAGCRSRGSEVENKMILMGHQILSCHAPVVRSFKGNSKVI
jgi:hypothetical protein